MSGRNFLALALAAAIVPCRGETPKYLDSYLEDDRFYISLTGLQPCAAYSLPGQMIAFVSTRDGRREQIACYEYVGSKIKVYLFREDLEFDAADEKYEFRENQCPDCKVVEPKELASV